MKKASWFAFAAALCALAGCVQVSLNPLYTERDLAFDPALLGTWQGEWRGGILTNDTNGILTTWNFTKGDGDKEYKLFFTDEEGKTAQFFVRRLKLGEALFLDFLPSDPTTSKQIGASITIATLFRCILSRGFCRLNQACKCRSLAERGSRNSSTKIVPRSGTSDLIKSGPV